MFTAYERDKLLLAMAAMVARDRLNRGIKLNHPEATALIAAQIIEWAREGKSVADLMELGATVLKDSQVMPGIAEMIESVQVEATFPDGSKLVTVHHPIRSEHAPVHPIPGELLPAAGSLSALAERKTVQLNLRNTGDRPIQVGSHYHFYETNKALDFPRDQAWGMRLNIPSGTAARFEPGLEYQVELISLGGSRTVHGFNALVSGQLDDPAVRKAGNARAKAAGFKGA